MSLAEILPALQALPRADKLRLIGLLADDLAREEGGGLGPIASFPVWSPIDAPDAERALLGLLSRDGNRP